MYPPIGQKSPLGILFVIIGLVLFVAVAGSFLLRLLFALLALWMVAFGVQLWTGKPLSLFIMKFGRD